MAFAKGTSGNPAGRPKGIVDKRLRIAQAFEGEGEEVAKVVLEAAKSGDMQAATLVLARLVPTLKPKAERTPFALDTSQPTADQANQVLKAVAAGDLDHDAGKALIDAIASIAQLKRFDEFEAQLNQMRQQLDRMGGTGSSGIVHFDMSKETR